jgi:hypothetical protein
VRLVGPDDFGVSRFRAKQKGRQVIENKQSRERSISRHPMISMTYAQAAKRFVSLGEMNPVDGS